MAGNGVSMLDAQSFRDLVSGKRRGVWATLLRGLLATAAVPYGAAVRIRNWRYEHSSRLVTKVGVPVVSVGNLTLGGTGKTPLVAWLARWFRDREIRVALISRGYGAEAGSRNDEALELEQALPDVPHLQNPDRVAAAHTAIEEFESQLLLLDDAFQHRRIHRDLNIVLVDALEPYGHGRLFPRGTLREPLGGLRRADVLVLSRANAVDADRRDAIRQRLGRYAPQAAWVEVAQEPVELLAADGATAPIDSLANQPVAAFCGIGNPAGFRHTLTDCGYNVTAFREFPDHHNYDRDDLESLAAWVAETSAAAAACTHKDLVKIKRQRLGPAPLWAVRIGVRIVSGRQELEARLAPIAEAARPHAGG